MITKKSVVRSLLIPLLVLHFFSYPAIGETAEKSLKTKNGSGVAQEVEQVFKKARRDFLAKKWKDSTEAIRKAQSFLQTEAARAVGKSKEALISAEEALQRIAGKVEKGAANSVRELDEAFSRANAALAQNYQRMADESWARKEGAKAGEEIRLAAFHLEKGIQRAGGKVESGARSVLQATDELAQKMITGAKVTDAEVGKVIQDLGKEIESLGKKVEKLIP